MAMIDYDITWTLTRHRHAPEEGCTMTNRLRILLPHILVVTTLALLVVPSVWAQVEETAQPGVLYACYVPPTGLVYLIKGPDLPKACVSEDHVEFIWTAVQFGSQENVGVELAQAAAKRGVPSQNWSLFGNSKSDPAKDKLGTTDFTDLVLVTDNQDRLRITAAGVVEIAGSLDIGENLTVQNNVLLNANLTGATINKGDFTVAEGSSTQLTGTLEVTDATTLNSTLVVAGATTLNSTLAANGQVTINASVAGGDASFGAYPLRVEGSDQGVAIKVNGSRSNANNFVTFFDGTGLVQGRIEGQTTLELLTDPEYIVQNAFLIAQEVIAVANVATGAANIVLSIANELAAATSVAPVVAVGVGAVAGTSGPVPSLIVAAAVEIGVAIAEEVVAAAELVIATGEIVAYNLFKNTQIGVTYQSGAGDYAEWLPKANVADKFYPGDIVGVKGGLISSSTDGAEQVFVISSRPAVLANVPEEGTEGAYEKVALMGQVPVKVLGIVERGDYIIPSGRIDGFGRAVKASDLRPEQYQQIVGIAWSSSDAPGFGHVNVAVGLNANDVSTLVMDQMTEISRLERQIDNTNRVLAELVPGYEETLASVQLTPVTPADAASKVPGTYPSSDDALISFTNDVPTYPELTREDLIKAIQLVEEQMRRNGDNVDDHPFYHRLRTDPAYKEQIMSGLVEGFNEATRRRATER